MRNYSKSLIFILSLCSSQVFAVRSRTENKNVDQIINCAKNIIIKDIGGISGVGEAANFLEATIRDGVDLFELRQIESECLLFSQRAPLNPTPVSKKRQFKVINASLGVKKLCEGFLAPRKSCFSLTIGATAALLFGGGVKVGAGTCSDTLGNRWLQMQVGGTANAGFYKGVSFLGGWSESDSSNKVVETSTFSSFKAGFILGYSSESSSTNATGASLGISFPAFGLTVGKGVQADIAIIPFPLNKSYLRSTLFQE